MRLSRDNHIYKRIEKLKPFEKRIVIETELHCRSDFKMFCRMYDTQINHYDWKPVFLNDKTLKIIDDLSENKQKYFKSILLLGEWYRQNRKDGIFTIEKEVFGNFGHIPYNDNMGDRIDELSHTELGRDLLAQDYLLKQLSSSLL